MAHAGLALSLAILYGLTKLLHGYKRPIQWAILCSMPLRELQKTLVSFRSHSLNLGLFEATIAIPIAILRATTASLIDSHAAVLRLLRHPAAGRHKKIGFAKLMQWLVSFGLFVLVYERLGLLSVPVFTIPCIVAYMMGFGAILNPDVASTLTRIKSVRHDGRKFRDDSSSGHRMNRYVTCLILSKFKGLIGTGLIMSIFVGSGLGLLFFSYKIAIEGKEAVFALTIYLEENNYAERIGIKKWMDEKQIPELIDAYTTKFYATVSQTLDSLAIYYNVTEIVDAFRQYSIGPNFQSSVTYSFPEKVNFRPLIETLNGIQSRVRNKEWKIFYRDIDGFLKEFISLIVREDLFENMKAFILQSLDVSKRLLASGTTLLVTGANLFFFLSISIISGAAGLLNFLSEVMVFCWLLYYLITLDSGGVMDHVLGMLPLSTPTRDRCAQVLGHAVSSVLLATAKVTFFQGCLTYLLFRFYCIHFLYMSTSLALLSAILPITPAWLSSIPAAAQLAMEARYVEAILLTAIHLILLDYGTTAIQDEIPGQNAYLTGLSILGGIAFFSSAVEGAIMSLLLMTVMFAMKNLYVEFVLASSSENSQ